MYFATRILSGFHYNHELSNKKIYMLFTGYEVRTEKYFPEVSEAARGRRPRDASESEGKYFLVRTDLNGK